MKTLSDKQIIEIKERAKKYSKKMVELKDEPEFKCHASRYSGMVQALEYVLILLDEYDEEMRLLP